MLMGLLLEPVVYVVRVVFEGANKSIAEREDMDKNNTASGERTS
jgi:hypothetical protein